MNRQQVLAKCWTVPRRLREFFVAMSSPLLKKSQYLGGSVNACISLFLLGVILSTTLAACSETVGANQGDVKLNLVSFSVTEAAHKQIIPKFVEKWKKEHNQNVVIETSYGGSLAQTDEVIAGKQEADVVHLALPLDVIRLAEAGLVNKDWQIRFPRRGIVSQSVATIVTRKDNPKNIKTWADLAKEDVNVLSANPQTSGIAIWQFLGLWGSVTQTGGEPEQAKEFVSKVYQKIPKLVQDARVASDLFFKEGQGDALVTYENEVFLAEQNQANASYFIPPLNISIDNPVAVVEKNVDKHGNRRVAEAFVDFLYSQEAQEEFTKFGYRSVNPFVAVATESKFPPIETLFNAQDLGGWSLIQKEFFAKGAIFDKIRANPPS
jgi:sulfate transport system substrate-binding protein